ncbi:glycosyltransferase family 2 protein, partial [bacterium]|nr:glycosyltransferase family 2 protein [bacterium]
MQEMIIETQLVTVIIPTIGRPAYIVNTLRSILSQSYRNLQIIISDNAPSDASEPLIASEGIDDPRIEFIEHPQRLEFSAHMNACLSCALGTFVMIVSDDDQISPDYIREMVFLMNKEPKAKVALGRQERISENDVGVISRSINLMPQEIISGLTYLKDTLSGKLQSGVLTNISMFVRLDDIRAVHGFKDYPYGFHVDNLVVFKLALMGSVALSSNPMYYRVYLASSGLSAPFESLLQATYSFTHDCAKAVCGVASIAPRDKKLLLRSLRNNNTRLLLSRMRHVYAPRLSLIALAGCITRVIRY